MASEKTLLVIAGPTASGKTALSIALAQHFRAPILSFDSRQCYRELNIGVAKPSPAELQAVPHYCIGTHSIHEPVDAAGFEKYALQTLEQLFKKSKESAGSPSAIFSNSEKQQDRFESSKWASTCQSLCCMNASTPGWTT
jgi:cytidylate kinase